MVNFNELGLNENILKVIEESGFSEPSEIQEKVIPIALTGKDVIGESATGSGKTLAFGAPILQNIKHGYGVSALILTPTRELTEQVCKALNIFSKYTELEICPIYGGVSINPQIDDLEIADVVVGTPGRILDHISRGTLDLSRLKILVLDEADRMLDMGFLKDVTKIINFCNKERQTLLFSATISDDITRISKKYMKNPVEVSVESYVDASKLEQIFYDVPFNQKFSLLIHLLKQENSKLVLVFCNTKRNSDFIGRNLVKFGFDALALHGDLSQYKRSQVLEHFHKSEKFILVCTDVAARGLDIKNVSHVYNYDCPPTSTDYIHRIGRTARAGKEGKAITLLSQNDFENFRKVKSDDSLNIKREELPEFETVAIDMSQRFRRSDGYRSGRGNYRSGRFGRKDDRGGRRFDRGERSEGRREPRRFQSYGNRDRRDDRGSRDDRGRGRSNFRSSGRRDSRDDRGRSSGRSSRPRSFSRRY